MDATGTVVAQVGYNAASRVRLDPGEWTLVNGDGLIGQCAAQAIQARGVRAIVLGHRPEGLAAARSARIDGAIFGVA